MNCKIRFLTIVCALLILGSGCAHRQAEEPFRPVDLNTGWQQGRYVQKVQNCEIILDASFSMGDNYQGQSNLKNGRELINNLNATMPDMGVNVIVRTFGQDKKLQRTSRILGPGVYDAEELHDAVARVKHPGFTSSRLDLAIRAAGRDLNGLPGDSALIIVCDGKRIDMSPIEESRLIKEQMGRHLSIYTVLVGDTRVGQNLMEQIAYAGGNGRAYNTDQLNTPDAMARFVHQVFLKTAEKPRDSDGDGIPDYKDQCPDTAPNTVVDELGCPLPEPEGVEVTEQGTWIFRDILFDTGKWNIKPSLSPVLNEVFSVLAENPTMRMEIRGHTDNVGSELYNLELSGNRARAVKDYLIGQGITEERISSVGYGFSEPIAANDTEAGRTMNRRVEFIPVR